jgi:hypothetical protein
LVKSIEMRWGGSPGIMDGNSRKKSFSSSVSVPWALSDGRKPATACRTPARAWTILS